MKPEKACKHSRSDWRRDTDTVTVTDRDQDQDRDEDEGAGAGGSAEVSLPALKLFCLIVSAFFLCVWCVRGAPK